MPDSFWETLTPNKPLFYIWDWTMRDGMLQGFVEGYYTTVKYIDWIKESDDTKIIEAESAYYVLRGINE